MTSAFQQAAASVQANTPGAPEPDSNLAESYTGGEKSQLFGGPVLLPSLLNKSHLLNTVRTGRIVKAPYDVQSRDFATKRPKFWGNDSKISYDAIDPNTSQKLRPVMDTVVELETEYRFTPAESAAIGRDPNLPDDGARAFYASGQDLKDLRALITKLGIRSEQEMVGLILTVTRVGQKPTAKGNPAWVNKIELVRPA